MIELRPHKNCLIGRKRFSRTLISIFVPKMTMKFITRISKHVSKTQRLYKTQDNSIVIYQSMIRQLRVNCFRKTPSRSKMFYQKKNQKRRRELPNSEFICVLVACAVYYKLLIIYVITMLYR